MGERHASSTRIKKMFLPHLSSFLLNLLRSYVHEYNSCKWSVYYFFSLVVKIRPTWECKEDGLSSEGHASKYGGNVGLAE